jgi:hypothetical protein
MFGLKFDSTPIQPKSFKFSQILYTYFLVCYTRCAHFSRASRAQKSTIVGELQES